MDEMGPVAAKSYPGQQLARVEPQSEPRRPTQRARQEIDYGRRDKGYVFGAFRPVTGEALTKTYGARSTLNWVDFLERVDEWLPADLDRVYAIIDNLSTHRASDVLLFSLQHPRSRVRLSTEVCRLSQPDRAVVEDAALAGAQRSPL
jgi:hypothetical protein